MARIKRRPDGRYCRTFSMDGKRYYVYTKNQKDLPEAVERKKEEIRQRNAGLQQDHDNPVVNDVFNMFIESLRTHDKESTLFCRKSQYNTLKNIQVTGGLTLGEMGIKDINAADIEQIQTTLIKQGKRPGTVNILMSLVKQIFRYAINRDILVNNPCKTLHNIPCDGVQARDTYHRSLTDDEIERFLKAAEKRHSFYLPLFIFALNTGCRLGEIGALTLDELKNGQVSIVRTLAPSEIGGVIFQSPKTESGKRTFELNQDALKAIEMQKRMLEVFGLDHRPAQIPKDEFTPKLPTLFCSHNGCLLSASNVNAEIVRCCAESGVVRFSSHGFRDTFASHFVRSYPNDWKTLQVILGHSDAKMTLNLYVHEDEKRRSETLKNFQIFA